MHPLSLKKKESRIAWQVLMQGIVAMDRKTRGTPGDEQDEYKQVRSKLIGAWRAGLLVGGLRPKRLVRDVIPERIRQETDLADLRKHNRKARAKAKREITTPRKRSAA